MRILRKFCVIVWLNFYVLTVTDCARPTSPPTRRAPSSSFSTSTFPTNTQAQSVSRGTQTQQNVSRGTQTQNTQTQTTKSPKIQTVATTKRITATATVTSRTWSSNRNDFVIPTPHVEALTPRGLRVSIDHIDGMELFSFHGKVKTRYDEETTILAKDVKHPVNGRWVFEDHEIRLNIGDRVDFWIFVQVNGMGQRQDNLSSVIKELVPISSSKPDKSGSSSFVTNIHHTTKIPHSTSTPSPPRTNKTPTRPQPSSSSSSTCNERNCYNLQTQSSSSLSLVNCDCNQFSQSISSSSITTTSRPSQNRPTTNRPQFIEQPHNIKQDNTLPLQVQVESLTEVLHELTKDMDIGTQLFLIGKQPPGTNPLEPVRDLIIQKLDLLDLETKIRHAYHTEQGILFEMSSPLDKKRILSRAKKRLHNSGHMVIDPQANNGQNLRPDLDTGYKVTGVSSSDDNRHQTLGDYYFSQESNKASTYSPPVGHPFSGSTFDDNNNKRVETTTKTSTNKDKPESTGVYLEDKRKPYDNYDPSYSSINSNTPQRNEQTNWQNDNQMPLNSQYFSNQKSQPSPSPPPSPSPVYYPNYQSDANFNQKNPVYESPERQDTVIRLPSSQPSLSSPIVQTFVQKPQIISNYPDGNSNFAPQYVSSDKRQSEAVVTTNYPQRPEIIITVAQPIPQRQEQTIPAKHSMSSASLLEYPAQVVKITNPNGNNDRRQVAHENIIIIKQPIQQEQSILPPTIHQVEVHRGPIEIIYKDTAGNREDTIYQTSSHTNRQNVPTYIQNPPPPSPSHRQQQQQQYSIQTDSSYRQQQQQQQFSSQPAQSPVNNIIKEQIASVFDTNVEKIPIVPTYDDNKPANPSTSITTQYSSSSQTGRQRSTPTSDAISTVVIAQQPSSPNNDNFSSGQNRKFESNSEYHRASNTNSNSNIRPIYVEARPQPSRVY